MGGQDGCVFRDWLAVFLDGDATVASDDKPVVTFIEDTGGDEDEEGGDPGIISWGTWFAINVGDVRDYSYGNANTADYDGDAVQNDPNAPPSDTQDEVIATGVLSNSNISAGFAIANSIYGNNPIPISINDGDEVIVTAQIIRDASGVPEIELIGNPDVGILDPTPDDEDDEQSCPQVALDINNLFDLSGDGDTNDEAALVAGAIALGLLVAGGPVGWIVYFTALGLLATYADANPQLGIGSTGEDGGCGGEESS